MSQSIRFKFTSTEPTNSVTDEILIPPFDVRGFDRFTLSYQNNLIGINLSGMIVQAAAGDAAFTSASNVPPEWVNIPTAVIATRPNLGQLATFRTPVVNNCYGYLRILGKTAVSASSGALTVSVEGISI